MARHRTTANRHHEPGNRKGSHHVRRNQHYRHRKPNFGSGAEIYPFGIRGGELTVASTPRTFDRQSNEWKDGETLFLRASVWREAAENVAESLTKGTRVIVSGRLKSRSYETKEGEKRTVVELEVDEIGPSLRYAAAKVNRTQRSNGQGGQQGGWASQGNTTQPGQSLPQDDPWSTPSSSTAGGWGNGPDSEPPF